MAKKFDCMWMSLEPTWKLLAKALSEPSIGFSQKASKVSQEHSKYLTLLYSYYTSYTCSVHACGCNYD